MHDANDYLVHHLDVFALATGGTVPKATVFGSLMATSLPFPSI